MNKKLIAISSTAVLVLGTGGLLLTPSNKPVIKSVTTVQAVTDSQPASQAPAPAENNAQLSGIPATGGSVAVGVNTTPSPKPPVIQSNSVSTGNPGNTTAAPMETTPPPEKQLVDRYLVYRDYPADTTREDGFCVYTYNDGSTSETWVGRRPKENSQRYQFECP